MKEIHKIINCVSGNVLAIGVDNKIIKKLEQNDRIENCNLLDCEMPITKEKNTKGKIVDLVIQDEELSPTQSDNNFNVGNNTFMLNSTDVNSEKLSENNAGFVPLRNFETVTNMSEKEAENPRDIISEQNKAALGEGINQQNVVDSEGNAGTIDVLPDMSYFESASENNDFSNDSGDGDNEVFGASLSVSSKKKSDSLVGEIQDTGLIAKAISSVLSEESS